MLYIYRNLMTCTNSYLSFTLTATVTIVLSRAGIAGDMPDKFDQDKITGARIATLGCDKSRLLKENRDKHIEKVAEDACPGRIRTANISTNQYIKYTSE